MGTFSTVHWVILAVIVFFIYRAFTRKRSASANVGNVEPRIRGDGTYSFEVVGESNYQKAFHKLFGEPGEGGGAVRVEADLVLENDNKHDSNAVRVDIRGLTVGYLPRQMAKNFRKAIKRDKHTKWSTFKAGAEVRGGWDRGGGDRGNYGVWLDLPSA
ncbi:MAG: HIRAN domain-containing protein [Gammaproteobacteria bacterium]|nr:HIRAN domain-containing protein [Gammaproteobacteria bacterium]MBU1530526.1 HIRAN domain-containing protein [Gammaproteobacteria bacterium]MBU2286651.1 HIRAN domain-containing protein [Gammaproteobacteria bacterium]